jgi:hypothetical protein
LENSNSKVARLKRKAPSDPAAIERRKRALLEELRQLKQLERAPRGRKANGDWKYEFLLGAWEEDKARRPNVPTTERQLEFIRKGIPAKYGLKIGTRRDQSRDDKSRVSAFRNALARGRWARNVRVLESLEQKGRRSLLSGYFEELADHAIRPFSLGFCKLVAVRPRYLKRRKERS